MALIEVQTKDGPRKVRVCDYCKTVCIPSGRYCSGRCAREAREQRQRMASVIDLAERTAKGAAKHE